MFQPAAHQHRPVADEPRARDADVRLTESASDLGVIVVVVVINHLVVVAAVFFAAAQSNDAFIYTVIHNYGNPYEKWNILSLIHI